MINNGGKNVDKTKKLNFLHFPSADIDYYSNGQLEIKSRIAFEIMRDGALYDLL